MCPKAHQQFSELKTIYKHQIPALLVFMFLHWWLDFRAFVFVILLVVWLQIFFPNDL